MNETMKMSKTVAITGASGVMGKASLDALLETEGIAVKALLRPSSRNRKLAGRIAADKHFTAVWGDLKDPVSVRRLVEGADIVLHIGGMVSPAADWHPAETMKVNTLAMKNIVDAMTSLSMEDVPLVYIGSVAQTGNRDICNRFGRTGDPIAPARFDAYALSKCRAELIMSESSLKRWVSFRQSGILHPKLLTKANDPIAFHVPLNGMLEWATVEDSARLMANVCTRELPETFWRRYYNISSGEAFRLTNYEFEKMILKAVGAPSPEKIFDTKWFALQNFHGQWYYDADVLEEYLGFRSNTTPREYFRHMAAQAPSYLRLTRFVPAFVMKLFMGHVAMNRTLGTRYWIRSGNMARINAFWGSREAYEAIPSWDGFGLSFPDSSISDIEMRRMLLDHGYDDTAPMEELVPETLHKAAAFRGGKVLSCALPSGLPLWDTPVEWECHQGHRFVLTPRTVLLGGYWCPECMADVDSYPAQAVHNAFLAQVVAPLHN